MRTRLPIAIVFLLHKKSLEDLLIVDFNLLYPLRFCSLPCLLCIASLLRFVCICLYVLSGFLWVASRLFLCIASYVSSVAIAVNSHKHYRSKSPSIPGTPSKKKDTTLSLAVTPSKGKSATNAIYCVVTWSSHPVFSGSCPHLAKYPPLNQLWTVFGNPPSAQYLRSASNLDKYKQSGKYFHGRLLLFVQDFHLPKVESLFRTTVSAWHSIVDSDNQKLMQELFELA